MADCRFGLGLRQGQIVSLPRDAVDFLRRTVRVRLQVRHVYGKAVFALPKDRKVRDVPLPAPMSLALATYVEQSLGLAETHHGRPDPGRVRGFLARRLTDET